MEQEILYCVRVILRHMIEKYFEACKNIPDNAQVVLHSFEDFVYNQTSDLGDKNK